MSLSGNMHNFFVTYYANFIIKIKQTEEMEIVLTSVHNDNEYDNEIKTKFYKQTKKSNTP